MCFKTFTNVCIEIYELDPIKFLTSPGLAWEASVKKTKVKILLPLDLRLDLTDIDILLMAEKCITWGTCHSIYRYVILIKNTWKIMIKIKTRHIFNMKIIYMLGQCHKSFQ